MDIRKQKKMYKLADYCKKGKVNKGMLTLSKRGIMYKFNNYELKLWQYYLGLLVISSLFAVISLIMTGEPLISLIVGVIIFGLIEFIFIESNNNDNRQILTDICNVYTLLNIDISNGVFISDCLNHIKSCVGNKRLRFALEELSNNINKGECSIDEALILFNNRFKSEDVSKLSGYMNELIKQGINDNLINKFNRETSQIISDVNKTYNKRMKNHINMIADILMLISIVLVISYIVVNIDFSVLKL